MSEWIADMNLYELREKYDNIIKNKNSDNNNLLESEIDIINKWESYINSANIFLI